MSDFILLIIKIVVVTGTLLTAVGYLVLLERRVAAWIQDRRGPNRVGIPLTSIRLFGLGQPLADGLKFLLKEEYIPGHVKKIPFILAPIIILGVAVAAFAVIPFGTTLKLGDKLLLDLVIAPDLDVGVVYIFAMSSLAVYGVILGGWASDNKYSFLGGLRASAQLIAYEIPLGLGILGVVLFAGSLNLQDIVNQQASSGYWNIFVQPLGLLVFMTAAMAEAARLPFDMPECEQELVGGYHTEYTGMKLAAFLMTEFIHMVTAAVLIVLLFLGGWHFWGITAGGTEETGIGMAILRYLIFSAKTLLVILLFMVIRWSWPRFRFDQIMNMAWKVMVPIGMMNLLFVAFASEILHTQKMQLAEVTAESAVVQEGTLGFVVLGMWVLAVLVVGVVSVLTARETIGNPPVKQSMY